jgi:hypothetical protein
MSYPSPLHLHLLRLPRVRYPLMLVTPLTGSLTLISLAMVMIHSDCDDYYHDYPEDPPDDSFCFDDLRHAL